MIWGLNADSQIRSRMSMGRRGNIVNVSKVGILVVGLVLCVLDRFVYGFWVASFVVTGNYDMRRSRSEILPHWQGSRFRRAKLGTASMHSRAARESGLPLRARAGR
jgi:hypothetical protein